MTKIGIVDTHCHLYIDNSPEEAEVLIERANEAGVIDIFMPNVDSSTVDDMLDIEARFSHCHAMMGLHPCSVKDDYLSEIAMVENWFKNRKFAGVGETGIDLYWDKTYYAEQRIAFNMQIEMSKDLGLPIIIHSRDSQDITIEMIRECQDGRLTGVFHCFGGTIDQAKAIIDLGFFMGIGGVLTYKKAELIPVIQKVGIENVVLETDSPYLAPVPLRGKKNEPGNLKYILSKLSEALSITEEDVAVKTSSNAKKLFNSFYVSNSR